MAKKHRGRNPQADKPPVNVSGGTTTAKLANPPPKQPSKADNSSGQQAPQQKNKKKHNKHSNKQNNKHKKMESSLVIEKYDAKDSLERLFRCGFHPKVTTKTPGEFRTLWGLWTWAEVIQTRISREEALKEVDDPKRLTRGPFMWRGSITEAEGHNESDESDEPTGKAGVVGLVALLQHVGAGPQIMEQIFMDGRKSVMKFARSSRAMWQVTTSSVNIWNCTAGRLENKGHPSVFVVSTPRYTVGEVRQALLDHPYGIMDPDHPDDWKLNAINMEDRIFWMVQMNYNRCQPAEVPFWATNLHREPLFLTKAIEAPVPVGRGWIDEETMDALRCLKPVQERTWKVNPFTGDVATNEPFVLTLNASMRNLRRMMVQIATQRTGIHVLHFHKTPLLDRRMLAIILKGCPNVTMVGVYDCPLIHYGDVICILDLISEINAARRLSGRPQITAFDFYPHFHEGVPYKVRGSARYGLTWAPLSLDVVQRGFFGILLKAFMKAKAMGLKLLFDEGKAFLDFVYRVPNVPFSAPGFLDALYRYVELRDDAPDREAEKMRIIYDFLKPVRLGLDRVKQDWPDWYISKMGKHFVFCSSCGYEYFEDFFTAAARQMRPHTRLCAPCTLQYQMDAETDHLKERKRKALTALCPDWQQKAFNVDAPILKKGEGLIRLATIVCERPPAPSPYTDADGIIRMPRYQEPLVRDNKVVLDSLMHLPSLADLTARDMESAKLWNAMETECNRSDVYCRVIQQLAYDHPKDARRGEVLIPAFWSTRFDFALPENFDEGQPPLPREWTGMNHNMDTALLFFAEMKKKGWS